MLVAVLGIEAALVATGLARRGHGHEGSAASADALVAERLTDPR